MDKKNQKSKVAKKGEKSTANHGSGKKSGGKTPNCMVSHRMVLASSSGEFVRSLRDLKTYRHFEEVKLSPKRLPPILEVIPEIEDAEERKIAAGAAACSPSYGRSIMSFRCSTPSCFICCRRKMPIVNGDDEMVSVAQEAPGTPLGFRSGNGEKVLASGNGSDQQPDVPEQDDIADNPSASCLDKLCDPCTLM